MRRLEGVSSARSSSAHTSGSSGPVGSSGSVRSSGSVSGSGSVDGTEIRLIWQAEGAGLTIAFNLNATAARVQEIVRAHLDPAGRRGVSDSTSAGFDDLVGRGPPRERSTGAVEQAVDSKPEDGRSAAPRCRDSPPLARWSAGQVFAKLKAMLLKAAVRPVGNATNEA
jgi:hypothetical protein